MTDALDIVANNPVRAHEAVQQAWAMGKALTIAGRKFHITAAEAEDDRTLLQNRYYWRACLQEIAEQASINGQRWTAEAWHELFKRMFLGYEIKKVRVAGKKRPTIIRRLKSTAKLKVRAMGDYLDKVQAFASTDLSVRFSVQKWQDYEA